jgi:RimJ/RimL family protein N-acetyltransferase
MHLRALNINDAATYHAFRLEGLRLYPDAFRSAYEDDIKKPIEWAQKRIVASSDNPDGFVLGAFDDEASQQLIGATSLETSSARKVKHVAHVLGMLTAPTHTRKGIGSALLQTLIDQARKISYVEQLHLTVTSTNATAIALYERHGFSRDGIERRALKIGTQYFDKLHMSLLLDKYPQGAEFEEQMKAALRIMDEKREALAKLSKL